MRAPVTQRGYGELRVAGDQDVFGSIGYTRREGRRLLRSINLNAPDPLTGVRPRLDRGPILQFESSGRSTPTKCG